MLPERTRTEFWILIVIIIFLFLANLNLLWLSQKVYLSMQELRLEISLNNACAKYSQQLNDKNLRKK